LAMQQFVKLMKWLCNLPYQSGGKGSHKENVLVLCGIDQEKKVSLCGAEKSFVGSHTSPTRRTLVRVRDAYTDPKRKLSISFIVEIRT
jgi:hypothetical protein